VQGIQFFDTKSQGEALSDPFFQNKYKLETDYKVQFSTASEFTILPEELAE